MKIVVLDGDRENPGDLSWEALEKLGELTEVELTTGSINSRSRPSGHLSGISGFFFCGSRKKQHPCFKLQCPEADPSGKSVQKTE